MDKSELRIGNVVSYEATAHIVRELHGDKILHTWAKTGGDRYYSTYEECEGFPITIEILDKFGFKEISNPPYKDRRGFQIGEDAARFIWCAGDVFKPLPDGFVTLNKKTVLNAFGGVEFVHQLQNIYYSLTGEELLWQE